MLAVRVHEYGGPEVLRLEEVPDPAPRPDEVLVQVRACALNHLDLWNRSGRPRPSLQLPRILGSDIAGVVQAVGELVEHVRVGDEVIVSPGVSCGRCRWCLQGDDNMCPHYHIIGMGRDGGYAQLVTVPAVNVIPKPRGLNFAEAAALPLVFLTAWHMLKARARLEPGETVLVWGAGSGVGSAAIQIAKLLGATVIAATGGSWKVQRAKALGADAVIDYKSEDVLRQVRVLTSGRGVDVVFEHVGQVTWETSIKALRPGGRLVTCGNTTGWEARTDLRYIFARQLTILGSYMGRKAELLELLPWVESGRLRPVVHAVLPLEEATRAHEILEAGEQFGKVVLEPPA
jgi:NADPH:quinone reductase and related Zn-dependent oxidoreductases